MFVRKMIDCLLNDNVSRNESRVKTTFIIAVNKWFFHLRGPAKVLDII